MITTHSSSLRGILLSLIFGLVGITMNTSFAQDQIYFLNGDKMEVKVTEVSKLEIKFIETAHPDGPVRVVNPADVYMIRYQNGKEEFFKHGRFDPLRKNWCATRKYFEQGNNQYFASFALGHGPSYGWIGLRYQGRIGKDLGFGWHAGGGLFPAIGSVDNTYFLYSGGLKFFFYRGWYIDVQYGTFAVRSDSYYDYETRLYKSREITLHGPSFTTGIDWFFNRYIGINAAIGVSYDVQEILGGPHILPAVEWGVVAKW